MIIHSPGGSVEAAEQVITYLRTKYDHIRAIIPQNAMSAATMLACACDEIIMGKHSAIGPIDPQITFPMQNGQLFTAPAHSILSEFEKAKQEILANPGVAPLWIPKVSSWPPAILDICEKTTLLAKTICLLETPTLTQQPIILQSGLEPIRIISPMGVQYLLLSLRRKD